MLGKKIKLLNVMKVYIKLFGTALFFFMYLFNATVLKKSNKELFYCKARHRDEIIFEILALVLWCLEELPAII